MVAFVFIFKVWTRKVIPKGQYKMPASNIGREGRDMGALVVGILTGEGGCCFL